MRDQTLLSPEIVANRNEYLDWETQPSTFKHYPRFCYRISLSTFPQLEWIRHIRSISERTSIASKAYYRLNVPSAGNLHPIEMYLQIRNVSGLLSGFYHWDVLHEELVLIEEIASQGCEPYLGLEERFDGVLLFLTLIPFRSAWKYGLRSWRYLYLDLGHQIANVHGVTHNNDMKMTKLSVVERTELQNMLGFSDDEVIAAVFALGQKGEKRVKKLSTPLMRVSPCDYLKEDERLTKALRHDALYMADITPYAKHWRHTSDQSRRSARYFNSLTIDDRVLKAIQKILHSDQIQLIHIVLQAHSMQLGAYVNGRCIQEGNFTAEIVHLLLDQRFLTHASMVSLIFSDRFDASTHIEAGMLAHEIYTLAEQMNAGCSGIGAFFDDEGSKWSSKALLYAVAIGGKDDNRGTKRD